MTTTETLGPAYPDRLREARRGRTGGAATPVRTGGVAACDVITGLAVLLGGFVVPVLGFVMLVLGFVMLGLGFAYPLRAARKRY